MIFIKLSRFHRARVPLVRTIVRPLAALGYWVESGILQTFYFPEISCDTITIQTEKLLTSNDTIPKVGFF